MVFVHAGTTLRRAATAWLACTALHAAAQTAGPAAPATPAAAGAAPVSKAFDDARDRLRDEETLKRLTDEGRVLYEKERIKLEGGQYCGQAVTLAEHGEFRLSIQAASKALVLGQAQADSSLVASAKRDLAITYSYAGDLDRADDFARQALAEAGGAQPTIAGPAWKVLGDVASRRGKVAEAIEDYRKADAGASAKYRPLIAVSLANAYVLAGRTAEAHALYRQVGDVPPALQNAYQRGLANLSLAEGDYPAALRAFQAVVARAGGSDAAYHRLWGQEGMARTLLLMNDKDGARRAYLDAARSAETMRGRFRSEEFKAGLFGDVQQIFDRAIALSVDAGDFDSAWTLSEQSRSRALLDVVRGRVNPEGGAAPDNEPVSQAAVRRALRPGEAIVEFHVLDDRVVAWVVRPDGVQGRVIATSRKALAADVEGFRQSIFSLSPAVKTWGERLHGLLIAPLGLKADEQLVVVPHDALHYLPFQALQSGGRYLIQDHALAFSPSASLAMQLSQRPPEQRGRLVAFGNPGTDPKLALPSAEKEVNLIGSLFPDNRIFVRNAASKRQFRDAASGADILHIAGHAEVDLIDPLQSRIRLAPEGGDDGFLEAREVYGLRLDSVSLVTLSACESGLGRIARGDEILGFTRSFLTAGASTLLVSLWPVADDSTELLMTTLYRALADGKPAAGAMRDGQLAVLGQRRFAHPFFWAPFDLMGDWRMQFRGAKAT